ncbi:MAG: hypothetical protein Q8J97_15485, partial [Flavobacteriaceae bacterium]|nr:hypothetical protein [Flavobacteriaceae bacterium]
VADEKFGHYLAIHNQTMVITAAGSSLSRGIVYVHQSRNLVHETAVVTRIPTIKPQPGDSFGAVVHFAFPEIYVQLPLTHDDDPPENVRRSQGCIHLYKYIRNISVEESFVTCDFSVITANVTLNCTVNMRDKSQRLVGDLNELPYFHPKVDFKSFGVYTFQMSRSILGPHEVVVLYKQRRIQSYHITVTNSIVAQQSNISCTPVVARAGDPVTCTVFTNSGSGEEIAKKDFDVVVFNMADAQLRPTAFDTATSQGIYRSPPPSDFIQTEALKTDFPTVQPAVTFLRHGVYQFTYTPWRAGPFAAFVMYKRIALQFPNPVIVDVVVPPVDESKSVVTCPRIGAPNRPVA